MVIIVGVRFPASSKVYYFSPGSLCIKQGDGVIVETIHGQEYGVVMEGPTEVAQNNLVVPLKEVLRLADDRDRKMRDQGEEKVQEAKRIAMEKIEAHQLEMKLVDVDFSFDGNKITFFFTADGRVDFRALVKDLAGIFRTRIELRQIGVRDEARMIGGLGCCGRPVCCRQFLKDFHPVSIKMAKEQNLSLNPTKISGICGRLMCCLQYEQATYEALRKEMPRIGTELYTPEGRGVVIATQVIAEKMRVRVQQPDDSYAIFDFHMSEVSTEGPVPRRAPEPLPELEVAEAWDNLNPLPEELGGPSEAEQGQSRQRSNGRGGRGRNNSRGNGNNRSGDSRPPGNRSAAPRREGEAQDGSGDGQRRRRSRGGGRGKSGPNAQGNPNAQGGQRPQNNPGGQNPNAAKNAGDAPPSGQKPQNNNNNRNRNRNRNRRPGGGKPPQSPNPGEN